MRDVLERVAACEPHIHATYLLAPERALAEARRVEARWAQRRADRARSTACPSRSRTISPPRGEPMPLGTAATELDPAAADAPPAARLREAGAIVFAKTTMPDYGMLSSGLSSFHPLTRNPWDLRRIPAAPPRARARRRRRATGRCTSAPTSAARCACRRAGAASSA